MLSQDVNASATTTAIKNDNFKIKIGNKTKFECRPGRVGNSMAVQIVKVLAKHGFTGDIPMPDVSTKAKAQQYIGLDMPKLEEKNQRFMDEIVPKWIEDAKAKGKLIDL